MGPLILGGTGCVGRALAAVWEGEAPLWQYRRPGSAPRGRTVRWDILTDAEPDLPEDLSGIVVLTGGRHMSTEDEITVANRAAHLAEGRGLRLLLASSQAIYGPPPDDAPVPEESSLRAEAGYGAQKARVEAAMAEYPCVTCLRLGNVAGCDALLGSAASGPVSLTRFADGTTPQRQWIGPVTLARVLAALLDHDGPLPPVLNVAQPDPVSMGDLMRAAGLDFADKPPMEGDLRALTLDLSALLAITVIPPASAASLIAEARAAGWVPA